MKNIIIFILFGLSPSLLAQEPVTEAALKERSLRITEQVRYDLKDDISQIQDLSIISIPTCEMVIKKDGNILFILNDESGYAVIQSNGKTIDYAVKYNKTMPYTLRKLDKDSTIYMGGSLLRLIDSDALAHSQYPFWIYTFTTRLFIGFGFFENNSLHFMSFLSSKPVLFDNPKDFFEFRFTSIKNYQKLKKANRK